MEKHQLFFVWEGEEATHLLIILSPPKKKQLQPIGDRVAVA